MTRLIFFCGHAGAGKTTLAKRALTELRQRTGETFCLLDKDTLYGNYSSAVMGVLTGNADDRDSPLFLKHLREPEYAGLLNTARENLALGVNCIVVGPLSREVQSHLLADRAWLRVGDDVRVQAVWVHLQEDEARRRIAARGNPNDAWKLAHWDDYRARLFTLTAVDYPELRLYDNTAPAAQDFDALLRALQAPSAS